MCETEENTCNTSVRHLLPKMFAPVVKLISDTYIGSAIHSSSATLDRKIKALSSRLLGAVLHGNRIVSINGVRYFLPDTEVETLFVLLPQYEKHVWRYLRPTKGQVFIDVGAHVGKYAMQVAPIVGKEGLVIALEPDLNNYEALLRSIELNSLENIVPFNVAAWHDNCRLKLYNAVVSIYHSVKIDAGSGWVVVEARTIDSIVDELGVEHVDWVKIDVEDAEVEVLRGLEKTLLRHRPNIILEIQYRNMDAIRKFAAARDYTLSPIVEEQTPRSNAGLFFATARRRRFDIEAEDRLNAWKTAD